MAIVTIYGHYPVATSGWSSARVSHHGHATGTSMPLAKLPQNLLYLFADRPVERNYPTGAYPS